MHVLNTYLGDMFLAKKQQENKNKTQEKKETKRKERKEKY